MMKTLSVKIYHDKHVFCWLKNRQDISSPNICLFFIQKLMKKDPLYIPKVCESAEIKGI